jgi:hypothetical protein
VELAGEVERFHERGLGLAAISYDSVAILKSFSERRQIPFPLLSDPDSEVIRAFGLLHPDYPEGHDLHGVPFPGTIVMDAEGRIVAKYFEESYRVRQTAASVFVREGDPGGGGRRLQAEHVSVTPSLSDATAVPGNRITLVLDLEMEPGHHAYAPGDHSYRGLTLNLEPDPLFTAHDTELPEPTPFHFAPLDETVPVYAGRFRVLKDVTFATGADIEKAIAEQPERTLRGILHYQVCSDRVCYPPRQVPVTWSVTFRPLDRERAPEPLRKHHRD